MEITIIQSSAIFAIVLPAAFVIWKFSKGQKIPLPEVVIVVIASSMLPIAGTLAIYSFRPNLIKSLDEISLQITITGFILIYVYGKIIWDKMMSNSS